MTESELQQRIVELEAQNLALVAENQKLRDALGLQSEIVVAPIQEPSLFTQEIEIQHTEKPNANVSFNKYNSVKEKIALFMSLFRGRTDVHAKRCYSKKHDSSYYIPVCKNEWVRGICDKSSVKCKNCTKRELLPLTESVIDSHLRNKDEHGVGIIGIYPLLSDETCLFLAVDFDDKSWQEDIAVFRSVCEELKIPVAIERSRSGNGGHAWLFFEEPISAVSARRLGNALLTKAMSVRHEIRFASYDRMFPNQDFMPKGGFGNLIALPLQKGPRKKGNSEFVDEAFQSYSDQWAYLASIKKMTESDITQLLAELCEGNGLGELGNTETDDESAPKPWERKKAEINLEIKDFPDKLCIVDANRLYVTKKGVSQRALNRIKRLAAFQNPEFYKAQRMRMSTYDIPRIIYSLDETPEYLGIPRGCRSSLINLLNDSQVNYVFDDERNKGKSIKVNFIGTLREEQQSAADALLQHETGVLSLPTAFGKTVIATSLIAQRKCNTLILVHLHTLLDQWKKSLEQFLKIDEVLPEAGTKKGRKKNRSIIGQLGGGKDKLSGIVDIAIVQSLIHNNEVKELVKDYGMVIVDECHHVPSVNYEKVLSAINAKYVYGLTATFARQDGQHPITLMQCGAIRYSVDAKAQAEKRDFEHYIIPCFTRFRKPFTQDETDWHITQIYSVLVEDDLRNRQITTDVIEAVNAGRTPIILTQRTEHVTILADLIKNQCDAHVIMLIGADSAKIKYETMDALKNVHPDEQLIIIATGKYVGEGFDYPRLDTLFLASPIAWKGTLAQYAGRLHRDYPGKQDVIVYDYVDIHIPVLERMYHKRLSGYAQIGYKTLTARNQPDKISMIYDANTFIPVIKNDFACARKEIVIACPRLRKNRIATVLEWLKEPINRGILVTIVTSPEESFNEDSISIIRKPNLYQKYVIIDERLVWYGSIGLLSFWGSEDSIMRLESKELAKELKAFVEK